MANNTNKVTKKFLIDETAKRTKQTKELVKNVTDTYISVIKEEVHKGNNVDIDKFGMFSNKISPAREGRNPSTGATIQIPEKVGVKFRIAKDFKRMVNNEPEPEKKTKDKKEK